MPRGTHKNQNTSLLTFFFLEIYLVVEHCRHARTSLRPVSSLRMAEKVDAEVVSGKSATAVKTEELIDSAKEAYSSVVVRGPWRVLLKQNFVQAKCPCVSST